MSSGTASGCCSASGSAPLVAGEHGARVDRDAVSMSRAWSHWPTKLRTNSSDRGSASIRSTWAGRFARSSPLAGQADQLVVGHRRPEEVGQPRGQGVFVDERMPASAAPGSAVLLAEQEPRRGQHGHHRLGDARLEGLARLRRRPPRRCATSRSTVASSTGRRKALRRRTGPAARGHTARRPRRRPGTSPGRTGRKFVGRTQCSLLHRPADGHRRDPHGERPDLLLVRRQRLELERQRVLARPPSSRRTRSGTSCRPASRTPAPSSSSPSALKTSRHRSESNRTRRRTLSRREVQDQLVAAVVLDLERVAETVAGS